MTFEHSDTDQLRILDTRNRIRTDKNPSRSDRIRIRPENIRTIYIPDVEVGSALIMVPGKSLGVVWIQELDFRPYNVKENHNI